LLLNLKLPSGRFKIIVRDNKSSMVLKKTCEKNCVTYLHGGQYGFGHNNNIAVSYIINNFMIMNNDYFLFLNPDVFITSESLINYVDYIISNDYKFSTLCLYRDFTKSKHDYSIRSFPTLYDFLCSFLLGVNKSKIKKENILSDTVVDWCAGSFMLIHALSFLNVNGFDQKYFMY
ncbi:TPA: glycosyltransferase family 2 protein, partial [Escherichia coli]|nr:glycosyltransferase family 2 protein [Escherichia coli]